MLRKIATFDFFPMLHIFSCAINRKLTTYAFYYELEDLFSALLPYYFSKSMLKRSCSEHVFLEWLMDFSVRSSGRQSGGDFKF